MITPLHCNQLERHLYDTIPNAWKELGHPVVPEPIPKPMTASATVARRMSMPVQRTKNKTPPKVYAPGHIMTRRMSAILDGTLPIEEKKPQRATTYRRQSVQVDRLQYETIISSSVSRVSKAKGKCFLIVHESVSNEIKAKFEFLQQIFLQNL